MEDRRFSGSQRPEDDPKEPGVFSKSVILVVKNPCVNDGCSVHLASFYYPDNLWTTNLSDCELGEYKDEDVICWWYPPTHETPEQKVVAAAIAYVTNEIGYCELRGAVKEYTDGSN
jgi:hypothetical protein